MARSFYKGERLGNRPPCLICMGPGRGSGPSSFPYGFSVWLCAAHRSVEFQTRRAGRDFAATLARAWAAAGCLTRARHRALDAHRARFVGEPPARERPGSYSWPELRREAERRFAAGEPPRRVMDDLRERESGGRAVPPSWRTLRRWFLEGRWTGGAPSRGRPPRPPPPPSGVERREDPVGVLGDLVAAPAGRAGERRARRERGVGARALYSTNSQSPWAGSTPCELAHDRGKRRLAVGAGGLHEDRAVGIVPRPSAARAARSRRRPSCRGGRRSPPVGSGRSPAGWARR